MGNSSSFRRSRQQENKILMVGLDSAGKTTALYKLKLGEITGIYIPPTLGFNVETIRHKNINFTVWDLSAKEKVRRVWERGHYYHNVDILIFVLDSSDKERVEECKDELWWFLEEDKLKDCILLILANKQDLPNAMSTEEVTEKLELDSIHDRDWHIQGTCAIKGDGLYEGLSWVSSILSQKRLKSVSKTTTSRPVTEKTNTLSS